MLPLKLSPAPVQEVKPLVEVVAPVVEEVEAAPAPPPAPAPAPVPASPLPPAATSAPFWFECLPQPPAPRESVAPPVHESVPPPEDLEAQPDPAHYDAPVVRPGTDTSRRTWVAALCLLLLAGLVVVLTGRAPRR